MATARRSKRSRDEGPRFIHWLTRDRQRFASDRTFQTFDELWAALVATTPVRTQCSSSNCVLYSMWTAIELLVGELKSPPPFMSLRVGKGGMPMHTLQTSSVLQNFLAKHSLRPPSAAVRGTSLGVLRAELQRGIVVAGMRVNMFDDDDTHVRSRNVQREFLDRQRQPSGKWGNSMIDHSVSVVGYCEVGGSGYLIMKDTQDPELFGHPTVHGCALLPIEEALANGQETELYTLCRADDCPPVKAKSFTGRRADLEELRPRKAKRELAGLGPMETYRPTHRGPTVTARVDSGPKAPRKSE